MAHAQAGELHAVAAELRVLVMPTEGGYFAQGLEVDYVATGDTEEQARERFADGFVRTVRAMIQRGRGLDGLFKSQTPPEYFKAYLGSALKPVFLCAVSIDLPQEAQRVLPTTLSFLSPQPLAC